MQFEYRKFTVATALLPTLLLFAACLPVPIGDPERSRVDPDLSGMWVRLGEGPAVVLVQPYDKRSWLVIGAGLEVGPDNDREYAESDEETYDELVELIQDAGVGPSGIIANRVEVFKAWRTRLGKRWFLTWEYKGVYDEDDGFTPEWWAVFRIDRQGKDEFSLRLIDGDFDGFVNVAETRRAYERVIKKYADNEQLYNDSSTVYVRVRPEHVGLFNEILANVISDPA